MKKYYIRKILVLLSLNRTLITLIIQIYTDCGLGGYLASLRLGFLTAKAQNFFAKGAKGDVMRAEKEISKLRRGNRTLMTLMIQIYTDCGLGGNLASLRLGLLTAKSQSFIAKGAKEDVIRAEKECSKLRRGNRTLMTQIIRIFTDCGLGGVLASLRFSFVTAKA